MQFDRRSFLLRTAAVSSCRVVRDLYFRILNCYMCVGDVQVFSPTVTGLDEKGDEIEKEVAAVHYSADKMDPHGR